MVLKVGNLTVTYGQKKAVDHISFQVKSGQVFGLLGANGAGKSSTLAAVLGIEKSTHDELVIVGKSPVRNRKEIFEQVGVQFQETNFQDKLTVSDACEQWRSLYKKRLTYLLYYNPLGWQIRKSNLLNYFLVGSVSDWPYFLP